MASPGVPDGGRLEVLESDGILDSDPEEIYDHLVELATQICDAPFGALSLVDEDRTWFKARVGLEVEQIPVEDSVCAHNIQDPSSMLVAEDLREDPRFAGSSLVVSEPELCFYAGAPVVTPDGHALGTVCVLDDEPRSLTEDQERALDLLADQAAYLLEIRRITGALHRSEQRLERAQKLAKVGDWELELETGEWTWSQEKYHIMGRDPSEGPPSTDWFVERIHPDDRSEIRAFMEDPEALADEPAEVTVRFLRDDGETRWLHARISAETGPDGEVTRLVGTDQDVTELKETERHLERAERVTGVGHRIVDLRTGEQTWSRNLYRLLARDPDDGPLSLSEFIERTHPDDRDRLRDNVEAIMEEDEELVTAEVRARRDDGETRWFRLQHVFREDAADEPLQLIGTVQDITAHKEHEALLERHRALFESSSDLMGLVTVAGKVLSVNPGGKRMLDHPEDADLSGHWLREFHTDRAFDQIREEAFPTAVEEGTWEGETTLLDADGEEIPVSLALTALEGPGDEVQTIAVVARDLRQRKQVEEQRARLREAEAQRRELEALTNFASHQLQEPLRDVGRFSQRLQRILGDDLPAEAEEALDYVLDGVSRLGEVLDGLREYGEVATRPIISEPVDLAEVVTEAMERVGGGDVRLEQRLDGPPKVHGSREQLDRLVEELLANAVRHHDGEHPTVRVELERDDGHYRLVVSDDGPGIPEGLRERVLEPFQVLDRDQGGVGIGLTLCHRVVSHHGGSLTIEDSDLGGTAVVVRLEAAD